MAKWVASPDFAQLTGHTLYSFACGNDKNVQGPHSCPLIMQLLNVGASDAAAPSSVGKPGLRVCGVTRNVRSWPRCSDFHGVCFYEGGSLERLEEIPWRIGASARLSNSLVEP